jgi:YHS domain-containing protein
MKAIKNFLAGPLAFYMIFLGPGTSAQAQTAENQLPKKHFWLTKSGVALDGYDATSYFTGKPIEGKKQFAISHQMIVYWFANQANLETFKANPNKYVPDYGGWCSYAIGAKGEKVEPDPKNFKLVNGKINLFYKDFFSNTRDDWNKDETNLKKKADQNWSQKIYK